MEFLAQENETIDALIYRIMGYSNANLVAQVMRLNPQFAGQIFLNKNAIVKLPLKSEIEKPKSNYINLWD